MSQHESAREYLSPHISEKQEPREYITRGSLSCSTILSAASWLEINRETFNANITRIKNVIGDRSLMAVVKGNAYGHGLVKIGRLCNENPAVAWLCTALLSEALILRDAGITKPILVMGFADCPLENAIIHSIDLTIWSLEQVQEINSIAQQLCVKAYIQLKIDTGLGRLGIMPEQVADLLNQIKQLSHIIVRGIFTHFSESNAPDNTYTEYQINRFDYALSQSAQSGITIPLIHAANSAGYMRFAHARYTAIRSAASMLGIAETRSIGMQTIMQWKTRVAALKIVPTGQAISYARTHVTEHTTHIAILPVGYADGYDRRLSNQGIVYIRDTACRVLGRVCMNMTLIDVTHLDDVALGDEVLLLGNQPGCTADDIATIIGSLNREIITRINPLIERFLI